MRNKCIVLDNSHVENMRIMDNETVSYYVVQMEDYYQREAKYISNEEIEKFIKIWKWHDNQEALAALTYFYNQTGSNRRILEKYKVSHHADTCIEKSDNSKCIRTSEVLINADNTDEPGQYVEFINSLTLKRYSRRTIDIYSPTRRAAQRWFSRRSV